MPSWAWIFSERVISSGPAHGLIDKASLSQHKIPSTITHSGAHAHTARPVGIAMLTILTHRWGSSKAWDMLKNNQPQQIDAMTRHANPDRMFPMVHNRRNIKECRPYEPARTIVYDFRKLPVDLLAKTTRLLMKRNNIPVLYAAAQAFSKSDGLEYIVNW